MKVLVVDDDVVSRMVLMHLVDGCGKFEILEAEDGQDAWEQLAAGLRPTIMFCDLRMPRLSGMDLLARVRADESMKGIPFVLVSSATERDTVDQASVLGATGYVVKPFQPEQVRLHMAPFCDAKPDASHTSETPSETLHRLSISADRLLVYLAGFQGQLTTASGEIDAMIARGELDMVRIRIERLHAGCLTLGLNGTAVALTALTSSVLDPERVQQTLADAVRAVMVQTEAVKRGMA
jgi:two-component system, chemotaxis family, chemotaxis protein CheY